MAIPLMVAAVVISAVGIAAQAHANSNTAKYNGQVADQNAANAASEGESAAEAQQRDAERRAGAATAAYGASGVDLGSGSPTDVLADSARNAMLDNLTIRHNAAVRGAGYTDMSNLDGSAAANDTTAGYLSAAGTIAGGVGKAYGTTDVPPPATSGSYLMSGSGTGQVTG